MASRPLIRQIDVAQYYRALLKGSAIRNSHRDGDDRVQDPYSLRCQPQVIGPAWTNCATPRWCWCARPMR